LIYAVDDHYSEGPHTSTIRHTVASADPAYNGAAVSFTGNGPTKATNPATVLVYITDNDIAGVNFSTTQLALAESGDGARQALGNESASYTVALSSQPRHPVIVNLVVDGQIRIDTNQLTFDQNNWQTEQRVTVTAINNDTADGLHRASIRHTIQSSDGIYTALPTDDVEISITDNDSAGVMLTAGALVLAEGSSQTYSLALTSQPVAPVTVNLKSDAGLDLNPKQLTFAVDNWQAVAQISVSAVENHTVNGAQTLRIQHSATSADSHYDAVSIAPLAVKVTDNDVAAIKVSATQMTVREGDSATYELVLTSQPLAPVTIRFDDDGQVQARTLNNNAQITFDQTNWQTAQRVKLLAVDDALVEGQHSGLVLYQTTSGDPSYNSAAVTPLNVTIEDNDQAGIVTQETPVQVTEGSAAGSYAVHLSSRPTAAVVIDISIPEASAGQVELNTNRLQFQPNSWQVPQQVVVTAVDDDEMEGNQTVAIHHVASSSDSDYNGRVVDDVVATITDNDRAAIVFIGDQINVTEGDLEKRAASYQVVLSAKPVADVVVTITTDGQTLVTPGSSQGATTTALRFTPANWQIAQTIYVAAKNDQLAEGPHTGAIHHTSSSNDAHYSGLPAVTLSVDIADDDGPSVSVKPGTITIREGAISGAGVAGYAMKLMSKPTADVRITAVAANGVLVNGAPSTDLTFTQNNWDQPQPVTVTASGNDLLDGARTVLINHSAASSDSAYAGLSVASVKVTVTDADAQEDADGDGVVNGDEDINGNGNLTDDDSDEDGIPDYLDPDDDNDGTPTIDEDTNGDGFFGNDDSDGDGIPDYLDNGDVAGTSQGLIYLPVVLR
jgi:hypothetical protein